MIPQLCAMRNWPVNRTDVKQKLSGDDQYGWTKLVIPYMEEDYESKAEWTDETIRRYDRRE